MTIFDLKRKKPKQPQTLMNRGFMQITFEKILFLNRIVTYISFNRNTKCLPLQKIINFVNKGMNYSFQIK